MKVLLFCVMLVSAGVQITAQTNTGVVTGKVTRLGGEGISGVEILFIGPLTGTAANAASFNPLMIAEIAEGANVPLVNLFTDNDGRFVFRNLAPGQYMVRAKRDGFVGAIPGIAGGFPTLVTTPVSVVAGSTTPEVSIKLLQGGTISGRVRDASGQAAANLTVAAFQVGYRDGQASLNSVSSRLTDDRGEYRIIFLPPGSYYVAVTQARQGAGAPILVPPLRLPDAGGTRTFFPGVLDARSAQLLAVTGGDISGIDISIRTVATFRIAGRIVSTLPVPNGQTRSASATLYLLSRDPGQVTDGLLASYQNYAADPGQFEIRGVMPGSYDLVATLPDSTGRTYPGRVRVEVGSQDLEGVTVSIHPGVAVKARIFVDGKFTPAPPSAPAVFTGPVSVGVAPPPPPPPSPRTPSTSVQLRSREVSPSPFDTAASNVTTDATGAYIFPSVAEGLYTVIVSGVPQNSYIADIREGGVSIYDSGLAVGNRTEALVDVLISSSAQSIRGTVRNAQGNPAASATVVLVPAMARRQNPWLFRTFRTNFNGEFSLNNVAPGDYKLFAWESIPNTAYMNAAFMEKYESRGRAVTLVAGGDSNFELTLIPYELIP